MVRDKPKLKKMLKDKPKPKPNKMLRQAQAQENLGHFQNLASPLNRKKKKNNNFIVIYFD